MTNTLPDFDYVSSVLNYDPATGALTWKRRPREHFANAQACGSWNTRFAGTEAGYVAKFGKNFYRLVRIDGRKYQAHRLAYLLHHGVWPKKQVDHCDGNGLNNQASNLRDVTNQENSRNAKMYLHNSSGVNGVSWHKPRNKWQAQIKVDGQIRFLGRFDTIEEAAAARLAANERYGFTARHGS